MKYFIDCGGHNSCSARIFRKLYDKNNEFHIFSFEIEPKHFKFYEDLPNHTLMKKAIWVHNDGMYFYRDSEPGKRGGSLIQRENKRRHGTEPIFVETIDIAAWLLENFSRVDNVYMKMDIEGAEYHVIPRMVQAGAFNILTKFMIEWHWYKCGIPEEVHEEIRKLIPVRCTQWPGVEKAVKILGANEWAKISR